MAIQIEETGGGYSLLHPGERLTLADIPAVQFELSKGIRAGKIRWCFDFSDTNILTAAVTAVLVAVAGGLRAFGGDLVIYRAQSAGDRILQDLGFGSFFRVITSLSVLESDHFSRPPVFGNRGEMEDALLMFKGDRDKERVRREDAPLHKGAEVELFDATRQSFSGRIVEIPAPGEALEEMTIGGLNLKGWSGPIAAHKVVSLRISDGRFIFDNYGVAVTHVEEDGRITVAIPPFFLRSDLRLHQRVEVNFAAQAIACDLAQLRKPFEARVVNLSLSGCVIRAAEKLPSGMLLSMGFEGVELSGKVVRKVREGIAVGFFGMDYGARRKLARLTKIAIPNLSQGRRGSAPL